ncbi:PAX-interacting protein 1-like [Spodoptera litura]|uniref:PAX-interacting protein 1-like n=1 Tax=Spodoptera litura TaxID=69820 RepID=A0A9J7EDX2_SPOLT|nr:PAX-interacting protein 1-like [Spodoptera litura]
MKLPISLVVLAVLSHATAQPVAKSSDTKPKDSNQTDKRELQEGNFGDRKPKEIAPKFASNEVPAKPDYEKQLKELIAQQSPEQQVFGVRLPPISKISDVLSGQGPAFEAALAKHLYSPVSVYHTRLGSPTSFEVQEPAASQVAAYPQTYKGQKADNENQQRLHPPQTADFPSVALYSVKQPRVRFESYPPADPGFPRVHPNLPQELYQPQTILKQPMSSIFPIYDQLGPIRYQGHVVPSQYLQQNRIYQFIPINPAYNYGDSDDTREKEFPIKENSQELKTETTERAQVQNEISTPKQGYHAHPNGAISFASFSQNIPFHAQYETVMQAPPNNIHYTQPEEIASAQLGQVAVQHQPVALQQHQHKLVPIKQPRFQYPQIFHKIIQEPQKYGQPAYPPIHQFITYKQHIPNQADVVNELPHHLIFQNPRPVSKGQIIEIPAFKPLPQSVLTAESYFPQTSSPSPKDSESQPYNYDEHSTPQPTNHIDQPIAPVLPQRQHTPLPPLKPNYNKYVKPLKPTRTTPIFLPTTLQPIPTTTESAQPFTDQFVSSTTEQPAFNNQDESKENILQLKTNSESRTPQPLESDETPLSLPASVLPLTRPTTYKPPLHNEYSTPQSQQRPTQSVGTPPRHDVVIQKQEIQELFFDPSPQPSSTPQYPLQEHEEHQLHSQVHHQIFEQLQPPQFQQELHETHSQQYRHVPRQSGSPQQQFASQQIQPQQYVILQQAYPLQRHPVKPDQLQSQQSAEQSQQQPTIEQAQSQPEQYQQHNLEPKNQDQVATTNPLEESKQSTTSTENQHQPDSQVQQQAKPQLTTGKTEEQPGKVSHSGISLQSYHGPVISSIQAMYAPPQQYLAHPEYGMVDVPVYPDVQYFGKFAEALFGNLQH